MSWFQRSAGPVSVTSVHASGAPAAAGAAALLTPDQVLTCAHVVNEALGLPQLSTGRPSGADLEVAFARGAARSRARIEVWVPPRSGTAVWHGDLCVLRLAEPAPQQVAPVTWTDMAPRQTLRAWHGCGDPVTFADVEMKLLDQEVGYLDGELSGAAIGPGFSGGPLWTPSGRTAVGLVVGRLATADRAPRAGDTVRRAWALPWQTVRAELERVGARALVTACRTVRAVSPQDPVGAGLVTTLRELLPVPAARVEPARHLARELKLDAPQDGSAPTIEELADELLSTPRALPTLTECLVTGPDGTRPERLNALLAYGRLMDAAGLLSHGEYAFLEEQLRDVTAWDDTLPARAAQEALRFTQPPEALRERVLRPDRVGEVIGELESCLEGEPVPRDSPQVPSLVHVVEFVAAALPEPRRQALQDWSDRVCGRLGVHPAARDQRRADARQWAGLPAAPRTRLLARLAVYGPAAPGRFRCRLWQQRRDGSRHRMDTVAGDAPLTPEEVATVIRDGAERLQHDTSSEPPTVEIEVDRAGLHLPVDEWETGRPNAFEPSLPLGVAFRLTLRCPEMSRQVPKRDAERQRRWGDGRGRTLVVGRDHADSREVAGLLRSTHLDANHVVLHGPPELRNQLLDLCLALGVPVVLWDREAQGHDHAARLAPVAPTGPLHELPDRVHRYRVRTLTSPAAHPARPCLVWEDHTWDGLARDDADLPLTDPDEGALSR
ncbi:trypsin-like peptidase domain-containing protein [Streptomyces sp. enrichment culture]|uniref:VMAP-C domain-containing protein n=1 Tax=Streptomyces sp. enrichment culture TaxID=1795815 RepID=UPI003F54A826